MKPPSALARAIFESGRKQKTVARMAYMDPTKLCHVIAGRRQASERERKNLAKLLNIQELELFPEPAVAEADQ